MKIDQKTFKTFVPEGFPLHFWSAQGLTMRLYCGPMTARGLCTQDCQNCKARLVEAMNFHDANNPGALLTWKLRNAVALAQEANQVLEHTAPRQNALGIKVESNPFEALLHETGA